MTWRFNGDYTDVDQVADFLPAFILERDTILARGAHPYNNDFRGKVPGLEGSDEDRAIYLLQRSVALLEHGRKLADYHDRGYVPLSIVEAPTRRFSSVVEHSFYMGGTGWREWTDARLEPFHTSMMVLPKGHRTRGHLITGEVLVKP